MPDVYTCINNFIFGFAQCNECHKERKYSIHVFMCHVNVHVVCAHKDEDSPLSNESIRISKVSTNRDQSSTRKA